MQLALSVTVMLVDLSVAVMQVTASAMLVLEVSAALMQVTVSSKDTLRVKIIYIG